MSDPVETLEELFALAVGLGARQVTGWSAAESAMVADLPPVPKKQIDKVRARIRAGEDPLGDAFCDLLSAEARRPLGAVYTPHHIVEAMIAWAKDQGIDPARVVDPGAGSGRFSVAAGRAFPKAELITSEVDPRAALLARAHLAAAGLARRAHVQLCDYRDVRLREVPGSTLFIGNPPYVRHHQIDPRWKQWLTTTAHLHGYSASQLAGLHVHFYLATAFAVGARAGDCGTFVTASEWLDVNYGGLLRELFLRDLGGLRLTVIEPTALPFPDTATTAVITGFRFGEKPKSIRVKRVTQPRELGRMTGGMLIRRERFESETRWSHLTRRETKPPSGFVELGELCRVHRGQVTGKNEVWIAGSHSEGLPDSVLFATVTKARELYAAGRKLAEAATLRRVIDLPVDLEELDDAHQQAVRAFLRRAKKMGAHNSYVARNRRAWWSVGLREPAPILATYMARRPPAFVMNVANARHINIAHGIYPREPLPSRVLWAIADYLGEHTSLRSGRTYAGGLTKFEPREMERLFVPDLETLIRVAHDEDATTLDA